MWREVTALWSLATFAMAPAAPVPLHAKLLAPIITEAAVPEMKMAVTPEMKDRFSECLREVAQQIKVEFADQVVAHHPISGSPIRVSDSRVTIEKIAAKLQQKTQSYVDNGGNFEIDLSWNKAENRWIISGFLISEKDAATGLLHRQYAKNLIELKSLLCP